VQWLFIFCVVQKQENRANGRPGIAIWTPALVMGRDGISRNDIAARVKPKYHTPRSCVSQSSERLDESVLSYTDALPVSTLFLLPLSSTTKPLVVRKFGGKRPFPNLGCVEPGTSAGFWLGGQCPLAAWGEENFENLTTKWCILKYILINMWSA